MRLGRVVIIASSVFCVAFVAFALYVITLFGHLKKAFVQQEEFVPTRLYSDVSRIAPSQPRANVEERLQSLGYALGVGPDAEPTHLHFALHVPDYPSFLIPDKHPLRDYWPKDPKEGGVRPAVGPSIDLTFDSEERDALLRSIELDGHEIPDLFLEPELVATLSQNGAEGKRQIREYVAFKDIPALIDKAVIAVEDQRFLEHSGIDPRGLLRMVWVDLKSRSFAQGGSTITLQLVKNLMERKGKNPFRKGVELLLAPLLELSFSKDQILERYLNEVNLGQVGNYEVRGVEEGAELFFGKKLDELNLGEIALMAGLIRGTTYYSPYKHRERAFERQRLVLRKMVETDQIAEAEAQAALKLPVRLQPPQTYTNKAPYFSDYVKADLLRQLKGKIASDVPEAGLRVYTTLDMLTNAAAQHAVGHGINELEARLKLPPSERLEGALAAVDQSTGYIRALVGGRNYGQSTFNRILNMRRQIGSTFKPIVYLTAFLKGNDPRGVPYAPAHPAEDAPWTLKFDHGRQEWTPKNYEKEFLGWIDFRAALAHSINTVAARLGMEIGLADIAHTARALGIDSSELPEVPSLSLGIAELTPVELLRAYAAIANHGTSEELTVIRAITKDNTEGVWYFAFHPQQVVDAGAADLLTDMMQSVFTEGTAHVALALGFDRAAAGKTGTTSNHRDSWFAGFTPQLTTVVWVGMDQTPVPEPSASPREKKKPAPKINLTGATSALPIWAAFMKEALAGEPPQGFPLSPAIADVSVDRRTGLRAESGCPLSQTVTGKYLREHEPAASSCAVTWPELERETVVE